MLITENSSFVQSVETVRSAPATICDALTHFHISDKLKIRLPTSHAPKLPPTYTHTHDST